MVKYRQFHIHRKTVTFLSIMWANTSKSHFVLAAGINVLLTSNDSMKKLQHNPGLKLGNWVKEDIEEEIQKLMIAKIEEGLADAQILSFLIKSTSMEKDINDEMEQLLQPGLRVCQNFKCKRE